MTPGRAFYSIKLDSNTNLMTMPHLDVVIIRAHQLRPLRHVAQPKLCSEDLACAGHIPMILCYDGALPGTQKARDAAVLTANRAKKATVSGVEVEWSGGGVEWGGEERRGEERRGEERRGEETRGEARRGEARRGEERRDP